MRIPFVLLAVLAVPLWNSCSGASDGPAGGARAVDRAVVLILADGLRADRVGSYGAERELTPNLDGLAAGAVRFEWAFAQAAERDASLASLMTGLYATTHGVIAGDDRLSDEAQTLAELLAASGFETAAFLDGAEDFGERGLAQGFGTFDTAPGALDRGLAWLESRPAGAAFVVLGLPPVTAIAKGADESEDSENPRSDGEPALNEAAGQAGSQQAPDADAIPAIAEGASESENYERRVAAMDERLGSVLDALEATGLLDRATVAFVSTTGADLGEHGQRATVGAAGEKGAVVARATGGATLYAPVTRVPLVMRSPRFTAPEAVDKIVELIDVMPTLLDLAGEDAPPDVQGRSLVPLVEGRGTPPYVAFGESHGKDAQYFVALGGYRMLLRSEGESDVAELYELASDPGETNDLAGEDERRLAVLRDHLAAWKKMTAAASLDPELRTEELDDDTLEQLKSLGYIQ